LVVRLSTGDSARAAALPMALSRQVDILGTGWFAGLGLMKIFHGPNNISGMAGVLAAAQRQFGHEAIAYCHDNPKYGYTYDRLMPSALENPNALAEFMRTEAMTFDVFHFYFGASLLGPHLHDVPFLVKSNKRVFFYFCGCDVRIAKEVIAKYPVSACKTCWPASCSPNRSWARKVALEMATGIFVSTPDLLEFLPNSVLLPQPLPVRQFADRGQGVAERDGARPIRVVHAPSDRMIKGTSHVIAAIDALRARGIAVELALLEGMRHDDAMNACAAADIAIDQVLVGAYGQFAVEMMALGKPVICFIRDDLWRHYPEDLPIISAEPRTLEAAVLSLIEARAEWPAIGEAGRHYAARVHDSAVVAERALQHYG
jgi:glycosyltransferase involved in cell wall biosynthesis